MTVDTLNARRSPQDQGAVALRLALVRLEKAVEAREGNTEAWEALQRRIAETARQV